MQNAGRAQGSHPMRPGQADGQASDVGPAPAQTLSPILNRRGSGWADFGPNQRS